MGAWRSTPDSVSRDSENACDGSARVSSWTTMRAGSAVAVSAMFEVAVERPLTTHCWPPREDDGLAVLERDQRSPSGPLRVAKASSLKMGQFW